MDRSSNKDSICESIIILGKKINKWIIREKKILQLLCIPIIWIQMYPLNILQPIDGITHLETVIIQIEWFQIMHFIIIHLMNSATITFVHITKIHAIHMIHHGNQQTNIKKKPFIKWKYNWLQKTRTKHYLLYWT